MFKLLNLKSFFLGVFVASLFFVPFAHAQNYGPIQGAWDQLGHAAGQGGAGYSAAVDPRLIVSNIIKMALSLIATVIFVLIVYAGYQWMTAGGNEDQIATAKQTIFNSTIGLVVILSAYGLTILITNLALGRSITSSTIGPTGISTGLP